MDRENGLELMFVSGCEKGEKMTSGMLSVAHLFQEREEWMGQEEEVVAAESREVGCQWESPELERKDVGCQSDSAERRDVAVQVDLLTQQLCGMAWRCVAVRADEPGGGALLQHCSTPRLRTQAIFNTLLPIMPLGGPASPIEALQPETKDIQQTVPLPSTPAADASSAPPPGLIAPLSPHLAEEEEGEGDEVSVKQEISDSVHVDKQSTVTVETKKSEQPVQPTPRSSTISQKRSSRRRRRNDGEKNHQSEEKRKVRTKIQDRRRNIQTGCVEAQTKHTQTEREEDKKLDVLRSEEKQQDSDVMKKKRRRRKRKKADGVTPVKMNSEVTNRPRRKAVGPPIRFLLEYEERSVGMSAANNRKARGPRGEEEKRRRGEVELKERSNSSQDVGGGMVLKQLHLSVHRKGSRLRGTTILRLRRLHHHSIRGRQRRNTAVPSGPRSVNKRAEEEVKGKKSEIEKRRTMEKDGVMVRHTRRSRREKERGEVGRRRSSREKLEEKLAQRPRRTMVGPPIRYLLESERSHGHTNQDVAKEVGGVTKPQKKTGAEGVASDDRSKTRELTDKQTESTNQDTACTPKRRVGRPKKIRLNSEAVGGASEMTNLTYVKRKTAGTKRESEKRCGDRQVKTEGGEEERKEEMKEAPQRQRRMMVGPPIRYLLEPERSHGHTNQDVAKEVGGVTKPQKKTGAEGVASDDRSKTRELTDKQTESTNQDTACTPKRRVGRPKKIRLNSEAVGGASEMTNLTNVKRKTAGTKRESEKRCGDRQVKTEGGEEERKEEMKEAPQRQRRMMVGPPIRYLLESEEQSHGLEVVGTGWEPNSQEKSENGGGALKQETTMIDRPEDTEQRVRQTGETEMKTGLINQDAAHKPKRQTKVRGHIEAGGGASEMTDGTEIKGHKGTQRRGRKRKRGIREEEVRQACENEGGGEGMGEDKKEKQTESPQRPRRTMVGPPIRYLLESEEQSHGRDTTNQGFGSVRNLPKGNEAGGGAVEDVERTERRAGKDVSETGGGASERQTGGTDTGTQKVPNTQTHLIYYDQQSGQVTIFYPCCVRLQRLL